MEKECSFCKEEGKKRMKKCECCKQNYICKDCQGEIHEYNDWMDVLPECSVCKKMICHNCIVFCHDCANIGEDFTVYCDDCQPENMESVGCGSHGHEWVTCGKHSGNCGECHANKNYDDKNRI